MVEAVSRAAFLRGAFIREDHRPHPPWAMAAAGFASVCDRCGKCQPACPEGILVAGRAGYPVVDFERGACTFCGACAEACPTGALVRESADATPWAITARIDESCLARRGISCRACEEPCDAEAVRFRPALGGRSLPAIDDDACSGCGACVRVCPTDAIRVATVSREEARP